MVRPQQSNRGHRFGGRQLSRIGLGDTRKQCVEAASASRARVQGALRQSGRLRCDEGVRHRFHDESQQLTLDGHAAAVSLVELNGDTRQVLHPSLTLSGRSILNLAIPRFGLRTIKLQDYAPYNK